MFPKVEIIAVTEEGTKKEAASSPLFLLIGLGWLIFGPVAYFLFLYLAGDSLDSSGFSSVTLFWGVSLVAAFLLSFFGGFAERNEKGRRYWWISACSVLAVIGYFIIFITNARFG